MVRSYKTGAYPKRQPVKKAITPSYIRSIARKAVHQVAEKKVINTQIDEDYLNTLNQCTNWYHLSPIASGVQRPNRIGNQVRLSDVEFKGVLRNNDTRTNFVRVVLVMVEDEVTPSGVYQLFEGTGTGGGDATDVSALPGLNTIYHPLNKSKVTVYVDRVFKLSHASTLEGQDAQFFSFKKLLRNTRIKFEGNVTGAGNQDRMLYMGAWAAEGPDDTGVGQQVEFSGCAQLRFTDV